MTITIDIPNELMDTPFDYISLTLCKEEGHITKVYALKELVKRVELEFKEGSRNERKYRICNGTDRCRRTSRRTVDLPVTYRNRSITDEGRT